MKTTDRGRTLQDLERLFHRGTVPSGDRALLDDFVSEGSEAAFEALVERHGPTVRGVCRRLLSNPHDADDAFQATFLVLARKAGRVRDPDRLGPWLYGVALRVAAKARAQAARRRDRDPIVADIPAPDESSAEWSDIRTIIDAELNRLRSKHRDVLILCLIEGATVEEASRRLGCPVGTVKSRLARARETLRARLTSRGVAPAAALAALASSNALASPVPSTLTRATLQTITAKVVPPGVAALVTGVAPTMFWKSTFAATMLVGSVGLSAAYWNQPPPAQEHPPPVRAEAKAAKADEQPSANVNNLKRILLALHEYHDANGMFPPPATLSADGGPLLSWRVALLPYLDQNELHQQFHLDEPWDSPRNKTLIEKMPSVFETPDAPAPESYTRFRGLAGRGTMFEPGPLARPDDKASGVRIADITDGTSYTLFITTARDPTPWTKPGELPFVEGQEFPAVDETEPRGLVLGMADGSVRFISPQSSPRFLNAVSTKDGWEAFDWSNPDNVQQRPAPPKPTPAEAPSPPTTPDDLHPLELLPAPRPIEAPLPPTSESATPPEPSVKQRLTDIEEKLDRLLRELGLDHPDRS